jgi:hypothetical protein
MFFWAPHAIAFGRALRALEGSAVAKVLSSHLDASAEQNQCECGAASPPVE